MSRFSRTICILFFAFSWMLIADLQAQQPRAPLPTQLKESRKVFVSNCGMDARSLSWFADAGDPNLPYNAFYTALKNSGRFDLVASPAEADLVLELSMEMPLIGGGKYEELEPQIRLRIVDAKTRFTLWSITQPVQKAMRTSTWVKNFNAALSTLMDELKAVTR